MLRINLLPVKQLKKRVEAQKQLFGMFFLFVVVLLAIAAVWFVQAQRISNLQRKIVALTEEKNSYNDTILAIDKLKADKAEFIRKTDEIKKIKVDSSLTIRTLDEIANRIDNQRMWLQSLEQQNSSLRLSGVALDNQTIAQFMNHLKESPFVQNVTLTDSSLKVISGRNLKHFELNCSIVHPRAQEFENSTSITSTTN